jgi:hypothetical protein
LIEHAYFDGLSHSQLALQFKLPLGTSPVSNPNAIPLRRVQWASTTRRRALLSSDFDAGRPDESEDML